MCLFASTVIYLGAYMLHVEKRYLQLCFSLHLYVYWQMYLCWPISMCSCKLTYIYVDI